MTTAKPKGTLAGGAAWMVAARMAERMLGLVSTVILARLLAPTDFGLVAMAMVVVAAADVLGAFGLDWALVRQPGLERRHLDTAWTFRMCLGLGSLALLLVLAVPAAAFYREPRITAMVVVMGVSLLIGALENPGVVMFRREMNFSKEFQLRTAAKVAGAVVAVAAAVAWRSYWALLLGVLASRTTATVMSYLVHPHRPRPTLAARRELLGFSIWLWLANILTFLRTRIVELVLGRIAGPRELGLFTVSNELSQLASTELAAPVNRALFSAYALNGEKPEAVGSAYLEAAPVIWAVTLPVTLGTYLTAPQMVMLILGAQWQDAAPVLRLLALAGCVGLLSTGAIHVYWAIGRARLETAMEACWVVCLLTLVMLLTPASGIMGAAWAMLLTSLVVLPLNLVLLRRYAHVSLRRTAARAWRIVAACLAMFVAVTVVMGRWSPADTREALMQITAMAGLGAATYIVVLLGTWWLAGRPDGPERTALRLIGTRLRPLTLAGRP